MQATCGFCEGSGVWADPGTNPATADPCPLCDGTGLHRSADAGADRPGSQAAPIGLSEILTALADLSPAERQRLYQDLHDRYDCRIYRR